MSLKYRLWSKFQEAKRTKSFAVLNLGKGLSIKIYPNHVLECSRVSSKPGDNELKTVARDASLEDFSIVWHGQRAFIVPDSVKDFEPPEPPLEAA